MFNIFPKGLCGRKPSRLTCASAESCVTHTIGPDYQKPLWVLVLWLYYYKVPSGARQQGASKESKSGKKKKKKECRIKQAVRKTECQNAAELGNKLDNLAEVECK